MANVVLLHPDGKILMNVGGPFAMQADGKVIAGGVGEAPPGYDEFSLVRLDINGSLDQGFGTSGRVNTAFSSKDTGGVSLMLLVVQPDGKIVAVGLSLDGALALTRYLP